MRINSFKYLMKQGCKGLWTNRINSISSFCIVTISLLMVGLTVLFSLNINKMIGAIERKNEIIVVISDDAPYESKTDLGDVLLSNPNIFEAVPYPKEQAWEDMQKDMSDEEKSLFQFIDENPLPDCYRVRISDISILDQTVSEIALYPYVEQVQAPDDFADILIGLRNITGILFTAATVSLVIVCFIIISNTIRAGVYSRRREINIMRYVGATKAFIEIPFFVEGLAIGLISALIAFGGTALAYNAIFDILSKNAQMWSVFGLASLIPFTEIAVPTLLCYCLFGCILCSLGTVFATRKHINV